MTLDRTHPGKASLSTVARSIRPNIVSRQASKPENVEENIPRAQELVGWIVGGVGPVNPGG